MGIYIKGMEMPKGNYYIDIRLFSDGWAHIPTDEPPYYNRAFEAIELPPHGRLTDADAMIRDIEKAIVPNEYIRNRNSDMVVFLKQQDTIIPADPEDMKGEKI